MSHYVLLPYECRICIFLSKLNTKISSLSSSKWNLKDFDTYSHVDVDISSKILRGQMFHFQGLTKQIRFILIELDSWSFTFPKNDFFFQPVLHKTVGFHIDPYQ